MPRTPPAQLEGSRPRPGVLVLLALCLALALGACGSSEGGGDGEGTRTTTRPGAGKPAVTLGTKNFTEQLILGELYSQALRAKGFTVRLKPNIGSSEITDKALTSGRLDLYPEYIGVIAVELAGATKRPASAQETYEIARRFQARRGFVTLRRTPFSDSLALAVKPAVARRLRLRDVGDLKRLGRFRFGGAPENRSRYQGLVGMRQAYGLTGAEFIPVLLGQQYKALDSGKVDVVNVLTTDGQLRGGRYTVLEDTKGIFGFQHVTPVVSRKVLRRQGPAFARTLDAVSARLTNRAMQSMNAAVDIDGRRPAVVAREFLQSRGMV